MDVRAPAPERRGERLDSLDALKGILLASIFMLGNPGRWDYSLMTQVEWHGCAFPFSYVFPGFMFAGGVAMALSFARAAAIPRPTLLRKSAVRSVRLLAVGVALAFFPWWTNELTPVVLSGVLQRIALATLFATPIILWLGPRDQVIATAVILLGYWALLALVPVPGIGAGVLESGKDLGAYLDGLTIGFGHDSDMNEESLLGTLPAIASVLLGALAGNWLRATPDPIRRAGGLIAGGAVAVVIAVGWGLVFPINKPLWTSTFVLYTGGFVSIFFGLLYYVIDARGLRRWAYPFLVFGANTLFGFALVAVLLELMRSVIMVGPGLPIQTWMIDHLIAIMPFPWSPLVFGLLQTLVWFGILAVLYHKKIFIKL